MLQNKKTMVLLTVLIAVSCSSVNSENATAPPLMSHENCPCNFENKLTDWQVLQMAIAMTESRFNPNAEGSSSDIGIFQIRPIYATEAARVSKIPFQHHDAWDIEKSIQMFNVVQDYHNPDHDILRAISLHNKARWYSARVLENMEFIRKMELVRQNILDYELR